MTFIPECLVEDALDAAIKAIKDRDEKIRKLEEEVAFWKNEVDRYWRRENGR